MALGQAQIHDEALAHLLSSTGAQWDDGTANFAFILLDNAYTPSDVHNDYQDVSANECTDVDYAAIACGTRAFVQSGADTYLDSADADYGSAVTIAARYLMCIQGNYASLGATDKIIFRVDLDDGGSANVSSTSSTFKITAPTNGWLKLNQA